MQNAVPCPKRNSEDAPNIYSSTPFGFGATTRQLYFRKQSSDEAVIKQILVDQLYNLNRVRRVAELLAFAKQQESGGRRPLIVDAGANIGASPLYFSGNMPSALIVAVEPDLDNFQLLSRNVDGLNVETIRGAVSSTTGHARLIDPGRGHWAYRMQPIEEKSEEPEGAVPRVTINDIYQSHLAAFFPFLVKVNIEGAEQDLFSGNTEWVSHTPILMVELHDWMLPKGGTSRPFLQCISKLDRDFVFNGPVICSIANDLDGVAASFNSFSR